MDTYHCPKCSRLLRRSDDLIIDGVNYPLFRCGNCTHRVCELGDIRDEPLAFCVNRVGAPFDPLGPVESGDFR